MMWMLVNRNGGYRLMLWWNRWVFIGFGCVGRRVWSLIFVCVWWCLCGLGCVVVVYCIFIVFGGFGVI